MGLTDVQKQYVLEHYGENTAKQLAGYLQVNPRQIYSYVQNSANTKEERWTEKELCVLKDYHLYNHEEMSKLLYNRTRSSIKAKVEETGYTKRNCLIDFSNIDTEEKAYILGFIAADGNIRHNDPYHVLQICLAEQDKEFLEDLRNRISPRHKISFIEKGPKEFPNSKGKIRNVQNQYYLGIGNKHLIHQLEKWELPINKSLVLRFPSFLSKELERHWVRGYFDGDGSITFGHQIIATVVGTEHVTASIREDFSKIFPNRCKICPSEKIFRLTYSGSTCEAFLDWIYKDATIYLPRKYNKYLKYKQDKGL
jgi:hypothetical protein